MTPPRTLDYTGFVSAQDPRTFPTNDIRNLEAQGGNANAIVGQGQDQSVDVGNAILEKLRRFQKYGRSQEVAGQQQQIQRMRQTPADMIGASPEQQNAVRQASVEAVQPTIGGARDLIAEAKSLMTEYQQTEEKNQTRAASLIDAAISSGATGLEELLRINPDLFKKAGYDTKSFEAILKGLKTREAEEARQFNIKNTPSGDTDQLYSGLSGTTATAVRSKVSKFSTEPMIQNFATIQDGYNFASSLSDTTKNPADDQALIYALAKALDPGSVVREGEYATAQKYAQSWINAYGKGIEQAISGTGFLSTQARKNIKTTIQQRYLASKSSYDNLYRQYVSSIDSLTGNQNGDLFLIDYTTPSSSNQTGDGVDQDLVDTIQSNMGNHPTREALRDAMIPVFPELTPDQIYQKILQLIPDRPTFKTNTTTGLNQGSFSKFQ